MNRKRRRYLPTLIAVGLSSMLVYWVVKSVPLPFRETWWRAGEGNWADPLHRRHRIADWFVLSIDAPNLPPRSDGYSPIVRLNCCAQVEF